jgi:hypothetical protein
MFLDRTALDQPRPANDTRADLTRRYRDAMRKSVEGIIEAGGVLVEGKEGQDDKPPLPRGQFTEWVTRDLKLGEGNGTDEKKMRDAAMRKAQMLMNVARHRVLKNPNHWFALPPSWRTLYEMTLIRPESRLVGMIRDGRINSGVTREEVIVLRGGRKQVNGRTPFFLNAVIAQLQLHITPLTDAQLKRELRTERCRVTRDTVMQVERLAKVAVQVVGQ